jgi:hypothetical protein
MTSFGPGSRALPWLAAAAFAVPALWACRDYGLAFDSQMWLPYGDRMLRYLTGTGPWPVTNSFARGMEAYGSLAALGAALTSALLHDGLGLAGPIAGHHAFVVLCGAALVGLTARLACDLAGTGAAVWAAALLATHPRFFAEAQNNLSDVPAAVASTAALLWIARAVHEQRRRPLVAAAVAAGALGAIRLPNLPFLPLVPLLGLGDGAARRGAAALWVSLRRGHLAGLVALALASFCCLRPLGMVAPGQEMAAILDHLWRAPPPFKGIVPVFYGGEVHFGGPRSYHLVMLAVTTPAAVLAAAALGAAVAWRRHRSAAWLLGAWIAVTIGRHAVLGRGNYDGVRHVLDAFPALAVVAGIGADAARGWLAGAAGGGRGRLRRAAAVAALAALLVAPGALAIRALHPYAVAYYNALVGGLTGAAARFEAEYSGAAYREGLEWAAARLPPGGLLWVGRTGIDRELVAVQARYLGLPHVRVRGGSRREVAAAWSGAEGEAFFMVLLRPRPAERLPEGVAPDALPLVHEVGREGVPFVRIRRVPAAVLRSAANAAAALPRPLPGDATRAGEGRTRPSTSSGRAVLQ